MYVLFDPHFSALYKIVIKKIRAVIHYSLALYIVINSLILKQTPIQCEANCKYVSPAAHFSPESKFSFHIE